MSDVLLLDSITDLTHDQHGRVAVCGSHGGLFTATLASRGGLRAVILNDAGKGLGGAGVAGIMALDTVGMAGAAADCMSCRIGSADDALQTGVISVVNTAAEALGVAAGQRVPEAASLLMAARAPAGMLDAAAEARSLRPLPDGGVVHVLDSASMVGPEHVGQIVITGSHGGIVGGDPQRALKAAARLAVFNDAGGGKDGIGYGRLPVLEAAGIAALTVSHMSARIGEGASAWETGVISRANASAAALGACEGRALQAFLVGLPPG